MSEWKDIGTAPKTGEWILAFGGHPDGRHDDVGYDGERDAYKIYRRDHGRFSDITPIRWDADIYDGGGWRFTSYDGGFYGEWIAPTHWQALPEKPTNIE